MSSVPKIAIIGAGVCGATVAFRLQEQFGQSVSITVFSEKLSPYTTGDISAGLWSPYNLGNTPAERGAKWGRDAHDFFFKLWQSGDAIEAGISLVSVTRITKDPVVKGFDKQWQTIPFDCRHLDTKTLDYYKKKNNQSYKCGVDFKTFTVEPVYFLPYLYKRILKAGGRIQQKRVESFDELESFDLVINCTGIGAHTLVKNDVDLKPIRGQVIRVRAPWITHAFVDEAAGNYIIPNLHSVVLGGTSQVDNYSLDVNADDRRHILEGCAKLDPSVKDAEIIEDMVGLRPGRTEVRLERDVHITKNGKKLPIVHNYGHGGTGVTLSYGCAIEVANIAGEILKPKHTKSKL